MKNILLLLSIILMLGNTSCIRERMCKNHTQCPTAPLILEYFGNYKPGNYWIFENQDGTKRDSIYVDNYSEYQYKSSESNTKEQDDCIEYFTSSFDIHSKYWGTSNKFLAKISNDGNCDGSTFGFTDTLNYGIFGLKARASDDTFQSTIQLVDFNTYTNNSVLYSKGFKYTNINSLVLGTPKIGIVQFLSRNTLDTFSLLKHYIQ
ncbi:MAG: hypothetical protein IT256_05075 [Chitinophagaceae bacterium]|nr:hypothetical protein [Chitinophagaceae bacterium]